VVRARSYHFLTYHLWFLYRRQVRRRRQSSVMAHIGMMSWHYLKVGNRSDRTLREHDSDATSPHPPFSCSKTPISSFPHVPPLTVPLLQLACLMFTHLGIMAWFDAANPEIAVLTWCECHLFPLSLMHFIGTSHERRPSAASTLKLHYKFLSVSVPRQPAKDIVSGHDNARQLPSGKVEATLRQR
jgi:hypothetical protein